MKPKAGKGTDWLGKQFLDNCSAESLDELLGIIKIIIEERHGQPNAWSH